MLSKNVLYYGREDPLPEQTTLTAGPLTVLFEQGDLRSIRLGNLEVLRRVYVAIRDRNWGTIAPTFSNLTVQDGGSSFQVAYDTLNRQNEIDFAWRGMISGDADGQLVFAMAGEARSTFLKNRIGFCVLLPAAAAGKRCLVSHTDGMQEEGALPVDISADQPVLPFADMRAISYEAAPGVWVDVTFSGDVFEMEDQRNWTDASYKIFCTPLALPYPAEIQAGMRVEQSIRIAVRQEQTNATETVQVTSGERPIELTPTGAWQKLPELGLGVASHGQPLLDREVALLRDLHLRHLRVDLLLSDSVYYDQLALATKQARDLGIGLEVALLVSEENMDAELSGLCRVLENVQPPVVSWLVYPSRERYQGGSPTAAVVRAARQHLTKYIGSTPLAAGTNTDFIFLKRTSPPADLIDQVCLSMNPQVHAFDNTSLVETLEAQPAAVNSARRLAHGKPVVVSPITLKPRSNPYATAAVVVPPGTLPPQVDPRQMSLFGAGWTLGSLRAMLECGASSVTYYETTGWRGVMETGQGSPLPEVFRDYPGAVFPLYHILRWFGDFAGGEGQVLQSTQPLAVSAFALRIGEKRRWLAANHTAQAQRVMIKAFPRATAVLQLLDEKNVAGAMQFPDDFGAQTLSPLPVVGQAVEINLLPYGLAHIDM